MKLKYYLYPFFIIAIFFTFLFPKYYFNKLEQKGQDVFTMIEEGKDKNDYKKVNTLILTHKSIINNQTKITKLLPQKYSEYLVKKKNLSQKYYEALAKFSVVKEYEAGIKDVYTKREEFIKLLNNSKDQKANAMDVYIALNAYANKKEILKKYLEQKFITQEFFDGLVSDMDKNTEIYNLLNDISEKKIAVSDMATRLNLIERKYENNDLGKLTEESNVKITAKLNYEWARNYKLVDQEKYLTDFYYEQNNLGKVKLVKKYETVKGDFNGDGNNETFVITDSIFTYNEKQEMIARLSEIIPLIKPIENSVKVLTLNKNDKKQVVRIDFAEANNVKSTFIFGLFNLKDGGETVLPICHTDKVKTAADCLFFSKNSDSLVISDTDGDGLAEVGNSIDSKKFKFNGNYFEEVK